ncbi:MAG TPA: peptide deformylase [Armatimonadota bacterium]|nr:peptide deformylase [Armatimonadota bacterium]
MSAPGKNDLKIVHYGHPGLRQKAKRVGRATADLRDLANRMVELMRASHGLGLAANQVGILRRIVVVETGEAAAVLVNPEIVSAEGAETAEEGCLSFPRLYGSVERPAEVVVRARDLSGKRFKMQGEGRLARALCHEIDHLNGDLFVDRVDEETLHWLVGETDEGEAVTQATTLEEALKVFTAARGRHD